MILRLTLPLNCEGHDPVIINTEAFAAAFPYHYMAYYANRIGTTVVLKSGETVNVAESTDQVYELIDGVLNPQPIIIDLPAPSGPDDTPVDMDAPE